MVTQEMTVLVVTSSSIRLLHLCSGSREDLHPIFLQAFLKYVSMVMFHMTHKMELDSAFHASMTILVVNKNQKLCTCCRGLP